MPFTWSFALFKGKSFKINRRITATGKIIYFDVSVFKAVIFKKRNNWANMILDTLETLVFIARDKYWEWFEKRETLMDRLSNVHRRERTHPCVRERARRSYEQMKEKQVLSRKFDVSVRSGCVVKTNRLCFLIDIEAARNGCWFFPTKTIYQS